MSNSTNYATVAETYKTGKLIADKHAKSFDRSLLLYILAFTVQGFTYLSIYGVMKALFTSPADINQAWKWFAIMILSLLFNGVARWFAHDFDYSDTMADISHNMRIKLGNKLRTMPLEKLNSHKTGELNSSLSSNVDESVVMLGMISGMFIEASLTPIVVVIGMFFIDWRMALLMMVIMPLTIPLYLRKRKNGSHEKAEMAQANSALESNIIEYIQGLPVLRATNQTGKNAKRLHDGIIEVRDLQRSTVWGTTLNLVMVDMIILFSLIMIALLGSIWVGNGTMSIPAVAALLVMVSRLMEPLSIFLALTSALDIMSAGFNRVKAIMETAPLNVDTPLCEASTFEIEFKNVDFTYHGQKERALNNCTIAIPGQGMTAIVGPSGSGKTTITKLMMRYADPQAGRIRIGGIDIRRMSQGHLLSCFSVVFQDVYLFDESILENIRMAKSDATDEEVMEAAKAACCHEFIKRLPEGYNTTVGDIGGSLSGGERQRISIARAILKDAPIVILDEPTAALDTESELAVQKAIDTLVENKTVIVIAHRLSTIAGADQILVIDDGKLIEKGDHSSLLKEHGKYHALWQAQLRSKEWHIGK